MKLNIGDGKKETHVIITYRELLELKKDGGFITVKKNSTIHVCEVPKKLMEEVRAGTTDQQWTREFKINCPPHKIISYDKKANTVTVCGGTETNPLTFADVKKCLKRVSHNNVN